MGVTLDRLLFDPTAIADGPLIGSYLLSSSGELIDSTGNDLHVLIQNTSLVVTATDLDIRDLSHTSDSIQIGDGTEIMLVNADGSINAVVTATDLDIRDLSHTTDSIAIGDGTDTLAINTDGSINTKQAAPTSIKATDADVTTTASELVATPLTGRTRILVQNRGDKSIYIGESSGVTTSTGLEIPKNASLEIPFGETADIFAIAESGTQDIRILEIA